MSVFSSRLYTLNAASSKARAVCYANVFVLYICVSSNFGKVVQIEFTLNRVRMAMFQLKVNWLLPVHTIKTKQYLFYGVSETRFEHSS